jgi:hypothetical protein
MGRYVRSLRCGGNLMDHNDIPIWKKTLQLAQRSVGKPQHPASYIVTKVATTRDDIFVDVIRDYMHIEVSTDMITGLSYETIYVQDKPVATISYGMKGSDAFKITATRLDKMVVQIQEKLVCPKCGTQYNMQTNATHCGECGTKLCRQVTVVEDGS